MGEYGERFNAAVAAELRAQRARGEKRITFDRIAAETGLSKSAVLNYFHGHRDIPLPALAEICRTLGVTRYDIFLAAERTFEQD